jgi:ABC-type uncharacterized transport system substrate-binding protein
MKRRAFVKGVLALSGAYALPAFAQRGAVPTIGFLNSGSANERAHLADAFRDGLREGGFVAGRDVAIEYRWAEGHTDRLPQLARELVDRKVTVLVATGGDPPVLAAKSMTSTVPIVFTGGSDSVKLGLVASLSRPGGNVTGVANIAGSLNPKRLQLLQELFPAATRVAYLVNPGNSQVKASVSEVQAAARSSGTRLTVLTAVNEAEIDAAFTAMKGDRVNAMVVATDPFFMSRRERIVALAARYAIPASYPFREYPTAGGLMSYGPNLADGYRQAGVYAARILKGAKPGDLPVVQLTKFELVLNGATAKKLGVKVSRDFLARVDEVIG